MSIANSTPSKCLTFIGRMTITSEKNIPDNFFETRDGLWVQSRFDDRFLDQEAVLTTIEVSKYVLDKGASEYSLHKELPENSTFEAGEFCGSIATMLSKQWGGKEGDLITNGHHNFFFVWGKNKRNCSVVLVTWSLGLNEWHIRHQNFINQDNSGSCVVFSRS